MIRAWCLTVSFRREPTAPDDVHHLDVPVERVLGGIHRQCSACPAAGGEPNSSESSRSSGIPLIHLCSHDLDGNVIHAQLPAQSRPSPTTSLPSPGWSRSYFFINQPGHHHAQQLPGVPGMRSTNFITLFRMNLNRTLEQLAAVLPVPLVVSVVVRPGLSFAVFSWCGVVSLGRRGSGGSTNVSVWGRPAANCS